MLKNIGEKGTIHVATVLGCSQASVYLALRDPTRDSDLMFNIREYVKKAFYVPKGRKKAKLRPEFAAN